jgi:hypothetical protein
VAGPLLCFSQKKSWQEMFDMDNEGPQHNAGLPPAPDSSNDADNDASQLEEAAAKKAKRKSRERVCELGPNNSRLQIHQE